MNRLGILSTHPIQYYSPLYRELAARPGLDLTVYYAHDPTPADQAAAGFGVGFAWDVPLLDGYRSEFLTNVSRRPGLSDSGGCNTPGVAEVIRRERFDAFLVHGWYTKSYHQAMRACWQTRTPLLVRGDSTLQVTKGRLRRAVKWVARRRLVPRFDGYAVVGQRAREYYLHYGAEPARMAASPHFVDNERFARQAAEARPRRAELRAKWGLPADAVVFLFVGKLLPGKRPLDLVRAVAAAGLPAAGLVVGDGPLLAPSRAEAARLGAAVGFTGFLNQSELPAAYAAADVVVVSSSSETWGLVVNEGMACGLPAVVTDQVGCGLDLVQPGEVGAVYPVGDVDALAAVAAGYAADPGRLAAESVAARRRVGGYTAAAAADGVCELAGRFG